LGSHKQSINYLPRLRKIVSIGRVKWFDKTAGKDNSCWYLFDKPSDIAVEFYGRKNPKRELEGKVWAAWS
jgi:hypothetical protein